MVHFLKAILWVPYWPSDISKPKNAGKNRRKGISLLLIYRRFEKIISVAAIAIGSKGTRVTCLQDFRIHKGVHFVMLLNLKPWSNASNISSNIYFQKHLKVCRSFWGGGQTHPTFRPTSQPTFPTNAPTLVTYAATCHQWWKVTIKQTFYRNCWFRKQNVAIVPSKTPNLMIHCLI